MFCRWWFLSCLLFLGKTSHFDLHFSIGLVQPPHRDNVCAKCRGSQKKLFGECFLVYNETTTWTMDLFKDHKRKHEIRILSLTSQYDIKYKNELFLSTVCSCGLMSNCMLYTYRSNPNDPCFDWKRPCFEGLTFKNRGHLGSIGRYIYICAYLHCIILMMLTMKLGSHCSRFLSAWELYKKRATRKGKRPVFFKVQQDLGVAGCP